LAKEKVPAFQFYPKDFLSDSNVALMSNTEVGIYILLMCHCWQDGALPLETASLAKMARMPLRQFTRLWEQSVLRHCFRVGDDGRLHHKRLDEERDKQESYRRRQSDAAASRWHMGRDTQPISHSHARANAESKEERSILEKGSGEKPAAVLAADDLGERARWLLESYPRWYAAQRHGARIPLLLGNLPFQEALVLCETWDDARLEKLARIVLTTDDEPFIQRSDRGWKIFTLKASWADDRLRQWERENAAKVSA
jgi:uncharacterized protein YdaU (DUF1376 family)